ncbi:MAG: D-alanine--D-alanine ligase [Candidatus Thioglobus sp.]|uniref:D-alanine--D-alanine ligase n=1 Tax=Candidatus Thioglobus sp. TaxID=2026721 RepID=UPI00261E963A|nr:D-alanine--D-alanine ligase [Candidatus Thioglobus sp.]MDC9726585.1 D-alanine--D-alanine ligase [Candidatus Thioglobus sp.]
MIAVLMGGNSAERSVSLKSGEAVYQALTNQHIPCFKFDWQGDNLDQLWQTTFDLAFIVLHGRGGEDGFIQQQLESRNIAYTGSNASASAQGMNKHLSKQFWATASLPLASSALAIKNNPVPLINFPLPWAVKPVCEGSSIGISKVSEHSQLTNALELAWQYDNQVLIEQWIEGDEYTVAILGDKTLPVIKIVSDQDFYNYESKYHSNTTQYLCPCGLDAEAERHLQTLALKAFKTIGASGWGRVDFIMDKNNQPFLLEINTVPGMTSHSLVPMAAEAAHIDFNQLVKQIANEV